MFISLTDPNGWKHCIRSDASNSYCLFSEKLKYWGNHFQTLNIFLKRALDILMKTQQEFTICSADTLQLKNSSSVPKIRVRPTDWVV